MTWSEAEQWVAAEVSGQVVTEKAAQLQDIDVEDRAGCTYSVKLQKRAASTGNFSFELELSDDAGQTMPGNFARCAADYCVIVVPLEEGPTAFCWEKEDLVAHFAEHQYPVKGLTAGALATNGGRRFNNARNLIVPAEAITDLCVWRKTLGVR